MRRGQLGRHRWPAIAATDLDGRAAATAAVDAHRSASSSATRASVPASRYLTMTGTRHGEALLACPGRAGGARAGHDHRIGGDDQRRARACPAARAPATRSKRRLWPVMMVPAPMTAPRLDGDALVEAGATAHEGPVLDDDRTRAGRLEHAADLDRGREMHALAPPARTSPPAHVSRSSSRGRPRRRCWRRTGGMMVTPGSRCTPLRTARATGHDTPGRAGLATPRVQASLSSRSSRP